MVAADRDPPARAGLARTLSGLPPTFWWLWAGVLVMALATFVFPYLALYLRARGYSVTETGLALALFGAGSIPSGPLAGWLADRLGRRPTLLGSLACASALTALLPAIAWPPVVVGLVLALGVAVHAYYPVANAIVADVVPPERYNDAFGLMYWERNAGVALSFVVGGALAARGFGVLFVADAVTTSLFAVLAWWRIPETRPAAAAPIRSAARARGWRDALADRALRELLLLNLLQILPLFQFMAALPIVMAERGLPPWVYGLAMSSNGILIVLLSPFTTRVAARFDPARVLAAAALLVAAGTGGYALCDVGWHFAVATAVWTLGEILMMPVFSALVAELSPPDLRGRYQGLFSLSFGLGLTLAPALGGACLEHLGARALWIASAATSGLVAAGQIAAGRRRGRARLARGAVSAA